MGNWCASGRWHGAWDATSGSEYPALVGTPYRLAGVPPVVGMAHGTQQVARGMALVGTPYRLAENAMPTANRKAQPAPCRLCRLHLQWINVPVY